MNSEVKLNDYIITFSQEVVLEIIKKSKYRNKSLEIGGLLIGQIADKNIHITDITEPDKSDISASNTFTRSVKNKNNLLKGKFLQSNKTKIYMGEWHTHPEPYPNISQVDKSMISTQFKKNIVLEPFLILLIVGYKDIFVGHYYNKQLSSTNVPIINL